jgi:hypothetical protein
LAAPGRFQFAELDFRVENEVLPIQQLVQNNGESLRLNLCYVDFAGGQQGSLSHALNEAEYSELLTVAFDHLRSKYRLTPDTLELILEPDNSRDWRGAQIGKALVAVKQRLHTAGYDPELIVPSTAAAGSAVSYLAELATIPGASGVAKTLAYHRYPSGDLVAILAAAQSSGMRTAMLEHFTGGVEELVEDLSVANVSAWQKYAVAQSSATQDYAYLTVDRRPVGSPGVSLNARAAPLLPYFKAVRRGAQRIEVTSDDPALKPLAFVNADGRYAVILKASSPTSVRVLGLPAATYELTSVGLSSTHADAGIAQVVGSSGTLSVQLAAGVTAVFARASGSGAIAAPALGAPALVSLAGALLGLAAYQLRRRRLEAGFARSGG